MVLPAIMWLVRQAVTITLDCISRRVVLEFTTLPTSCAMLLNVTASKAMPPASLSPKPLVFLCAKKTVKARTMICTPRIMTGMQNKSLGNYMESWNDAR